MDNESVDHIEIEKRADRIEVEKSADHIEIEKAEGAGGQEVKTGPGDSGLPIEDYDSLTVEQAAARLDWLSRVEMEEVKSYEQEHKNRKTLIEQLDKRLADEEEQEESSMNRILAFRVPELDLCGRWRRRYRPFLAYALRRPSIPPGIWKTLPGSTKSPGQPAPKPWNRFPFRFI